MTVTMVGLTERPEVKAARERELIFFEKSFIKSVKVVFQQVNGPHEDPAPAGR